MTDLLAARIQMGVSLGFHIIFATIGIAMPFLMAIAHGSWIRSGNALDRSLTQAWSKGVAIFFATGAVSGTVLSLELGLLWPYFMKHAGPIIGMPFSWEGTAFFLEAIAIGIFLYGWNRIPRWAHWMSGLGVGITGVLSGLFVICANAWMNSPTGFDWINGQAVHIDPWKAMFNPAALKMGIHMTLAAFAATGFGVAGVHAFGMLQSSRPDSKKDHHRAYEFHRRACRIALLMGSLAAILQPLQGDRLAKQTAKLQPAKFAAMESLFRTSQPAPLLIGGLPNVETETTSFGIHVPKLLSFLAHGDWSAEVKGLDQFPKEEWPPILPVHLAFQVMVGIGSFLLVVGPCSWFVGFKNPHKKTPPWILKILVFCAPLGFIAIEAGWTVTEVGRQPWIIDHILKTSEALTPMPGLALPMTLYLLIYLFLSVVLVWLMVRQFRKVNEICGLDP